MESKTFYITTPIYYPSDNLHIGHAYCTVATDAMARYKRMRGYDVRFLTGTDEHGQKIERKAQAAGVTPQQYVDNIVAGIKELWKLMNISYDDFIRTTEPRHVKSVQKIFKQLYDQGDIYKSEYEGWYCTPCESFWTETQLVDGKCPDCGRPVEKMKEESYFFRLSKYQDRLMDLFLHDENFIQPASRRNEMINNFLKPGLEDLAVSRTSFKWGIPVTFDDKHIIYVWVDALSNYITALGYGSEDDSLYKKYWPADVHVVGKEIIRFHTIIWPAILMALGLPLPKQVFGHGWIIMADGKMSKSKGNIVDPVMLCERYGVDAIRYFLLREMPFGSDGYFSNEALVNRINADLANDLGNLVSRTCAMAEKYFGGTLPEEQQGAPLDDELKKLCADTVAEYEKNMDSFQFSTAMVAVWKFISRANKYIDETEPWVLAKSEDGKKRLAAVLYNLLESIRIASVLIFPFMPSTTPAIQSRLGLASDSPLCAYESVYAFGALPHVVTASKGENLFPRIDLEKELAFIEKEKELAREKAAQLAAESEKLAAMEQAKKQGAACEAAGSAAAAEDAAEKPAAPAEIDIDHFGAVELRVGHILACEPVKKSEKLLKMQVDTGDGTRQIVSGIAKWYGPDDLIGRKVVVVANLKPAKLRGEESRGMLLAADTADGGARVVFVDDDLAPGTKIR